MKVKIEKIDRRQSEQVIIQCYKVTDQKASIVDFVKTTGDSMAGCIDERVTQVFLPDIFMLRPWTITFSLTRILRILSKPPCCWHKTEGAFSAPK